MVGLWEGREEGLLEKEKGVRNTSHSPEQGGGDSVVFGGYRPECGLRSPQVQTLRRRLGLFQVSDPGSSDL